MDKHETIPIPSYPGVTLHPERWAAYVRERERSEAERQRDEERAVLAEEAERLRTRGFRIMHGW